MSRAPERVLLVEGAEDKRVLPQFVEFAGVPWGSKQAPIVTIRDYEGVEKLLAAGEIETALKASGLRALGVVVDADENAEARWHAIRSRVEKVYESIPKTLSPDGVILTREGFPSFGAWIMPDNSQTGMLETFLLHLRPNDNPRLVDLATQVVDDAKRCGAPFAEAHRDKALIYTWLAWQDPPGRQLHNAIMQRMLRADSALARAFLNWFCRLYQIPVPTQK